MSQAHCDDAGAPRAGTALPRRGAGAAATFPAHHRSTRGDSGFEFRGHAALLDAPDPRRLDLHASLRDPFGNWIVRVYSQRKAIPVVMVADLSASMGFEGAQRKLDVLADFVDSLAWSAWRTGDSFGFVGCDSAVRDDVLLPQTRARGVGIALAAQACARWHLAGPLGASAADGAPAPGAAALAGVPGLGLPPAAGRGRAPCSPAWPHHDVVPVVLWDPLEFSLDAQRAAWRMSIDPESGAAAAGVVAAGAARALAGGAAASAATRCCSMFRAQRLKPLFIEGAFDADAVTRHFHS